MKSGKAAVAGNELPTSLEFQIRHLYDELVKLLLLLFGAKRIPGRIGNLTVARNARSLEYFHFLNPGFEEILYAELQSAPFIQQPW